MSRRLQEENRQLRERLEEAEETLRAIRSGEADALLVAEDDEPKVYTLKGAERPYRLLVENMLDAAVLLTQGGAILFANRSLAVLLGVELESLPGEPFGKYLPEESTAKWIEMMSGERARAHLQLRRPADGAEIPVRVAFNSLSFNGQEFRSALLTDLRPVARAAQQLAHQSAARAKAEHLAERLRLALEAADLGTYEWLSPHGPIVWSPEVERMFGVAPESFDGTVEAWLARVHPDDRRETARKAIDAFRTGTYEHEYRCVRPDGAMRWICAHGTVVGDGDQARLIGVMQDVTDQKQAEAALRDADRRKDEFLAMLAHELRNPLAPIRNAVEFLKCVASGDENLVKAREIISRQVRHLMRLVDDLLDVSRITRGVISLQLAPVPLAEIVDVAMEAAQPLIDGNEHSVSIDLGPEALRVSGDAARLCQVLANLLTNAAKFTPRAGHIAITTYRDGHNAVLSVRDTGVGIPQELQPKVFELFAQEASSLERSQGGLGIGLTLAKRIIELHGGRIELRSDGRNKGSEFLVRLPALAPSGVTHLEPPAQAEPTARTGLRVLVVEDNVDAPESFRMLLELGGNEVRVAHDGLAALRMLGTFRADVAFIDLGLPGIDGFELATRLRQQQSHEPTYLIALSGYGQEEDKVKAREAGFNEHLTKPVDFATIERVLSMQRRAVVGIAPATVH